MNPVVLLSYKDVSAWTSCAHLLNELKHVYQLAYSERLILIEVKEDDPRDTAIAIKRISEISPSIVIFADHRMTYLASWIKEIKTISNRSQKIHWVVHAFGCFLGKTKEWIDMCEALRSDPVSILCCSIAQVKAAAQLFQNQKCVKLFRIPYKHNHNFRPELRSGLRELLGIKNNEFALIYAGRISYQKNVHHLIKLIHQYNERGFKKIKLFVCGQPDNVNPREIPHGYYLNYAPELFMDALEYANASTKQITYLGNLSTIDLYEHFEAMDCAISLSTLEGEDYGRSLVESLATGLPVIATRWGGHRDLETLPQVETIKVCLENETLKIDIDQFNQVLDTLQHYDKMVNQTHFKNEFNPSGAAAKLVQLLNEQENCGGFTKKAIIHVEKLEASWKAKEFFINYEQILQSYWS